MYFKQYRKYLQSEVWLKKKEQKLDEEPFCEKPDKDCVPQLEVYHLTYKNVGHEDMEDLQTLCVVHYRHAHFARLDCKICKGKVYVGSGQVRIAALNFNLNLEEVCERRVCEHCSKAYINPKDADLSAQHLALVAACKTPDEEAYVLDWWIRSSYSYEGAIEELKRYRERIKKRRQVRRKIPPLSEEYYTQPSSCKPEDLVSNLTDREKYVWFLKSEGFDYREIGGVIGVSYMTVMRILDSIQRKIGK